MEARLRFGVFTAILLLMVSWETLRPTRHLGLQPCRLDLCASAEHTYQFPDSVLLVFCKAPIAGQVKTRLQPELSAEQAVAAHINLIQMTLDRAFQQKLCPVVLCCSPAPAIR